MVNSKENLLVHHPSAVILLICFQYQLYSPITPFSEIFFENCFQVRKYHFQILIYVVQFYLLISKNLTLASKEFIFLIRTNIILSIHLQVLYILAFALRLIVLISSDHLIIKLSTHFDSFSIYQVQSNNQKCRLLLFYPPPIGLLAQLFLCFQLMLMKLSPSSLHRFCTYYFSRMLTMIICDLNKLKQYIKLQFFVVIQNIQIICTSMADLEYRSKTISQLVSQLHSMGNTAVRIVPSKLCAIHEIDSPNIKRYRSKPNSNNMTASQFFMVGQSEKKYNYNHISNLVSKEIIKQISIWLNMGYRTNIILSRQSYMKVPQIISEIYKSLNKSNEQEDSTILCNFYKFSLKNIDLKNNKKSINDQLTKKNVTDDINIQEKFHQIIGGLKALNKLYKQSIQKNDEQGLQILTLGFPITDSETSENFITRVSFILLPEQLLNLDSKNGVLSAVRKQLFSILNYIKTNPSKRYQQLNKVITKRHWLTEKYCELFLGERVNFVLNFINKSSSQNSASQKNQNKNKSPIREKYSYNFYGKFEFFDKLYSITNLVKKSTESTFQILQPLPLKVKQPETKNMLQHHFKHQNQEKSQMQYCRGLERKTHKYSIIQDQSQNQHSHFQQIGQIQQQLFQSPAPFFKFSNNSKISNENTNFICQEKTFSDAKINDFDSNGKLSERINKDDAIALLKAKQAREISQYHATIQSLNKKILALSKQKGLDELCGAYEKDIMMLQLKIKELRQQISDLLELNNNKTSKSKSPQKINQNQQVIKYRTLLKKSNDQIKILQEKSIANKAGLGKIKTLEKQLELWKKKYDQSEYSKSLLQDQIKALTKKVEMQTTLNQYIQQPSNVKKQSLSFKQQQFFEDFTKLLENTKKSPQNNPLLKTKLIGLLQQLSEARDTILECNNFLVELQEHLQFKLGQKDPQVVLDCNRFIRGFLMNNLSIL